MRITSSSVFRTANLQIFDDRYRLGLENLIPNFAALFPDVVASAFSVHLDRMINVETEGSV